MRIRTILASGAVALAVVGGGVTAAGASTTHVRSVPTATGSVALSGPIQYVSFSAFARPGFHGWIDYTNFTYRAAGTNVWNISGASALTFASTYAHTMTVTTVTPLSNHGTRFSGTGVYNTDHTYTWTVNGTVNWNSIWFSIVYTGTNAGYRVSGHGRLGVPGAELPGPGEVGRHQWPQRPLRVHHPGQCASGAGGSAHRRQGARRRTRLHERHLCSRCRYELAQRAGHPVPDHERQHCHSSSVIE